MDYQALIQDYGYLAILIGTFLEGETILILGGVAAQLGALDITLVMLSAFAGSSAGDQLYYFIGRWKGRQLLDRFPRWKGPAYKVMHHVERHQNLVILSFRFFYGVRNVTPFVLGSCHIPIPKFVTLNLIGAAIWAFSFAMLGYVLGEAHERIFGRGFGLMLVGALVLVGLALWAYRRWSASRIPATDETPEKTPPR